MSALALFVAYPLDQCPARTTYPHINTFSFDKRIFVAHFAINRNKPIKKYTRGQYLLSVN